MNKMTFEEKEEAFMLERNHYEENGTMYPAAPRRRRKASLPRKLAALCLSGAVLGGAAAGGYYGVSCLLPEEDTTVHQTISASAMSLDGTSQSVGGLDVSDIAAEALPSVVSISLSRRSSNSTAGSGIMASGRPHSRKPPAAAPA